MASLFLNSSSNSSELMSSYMYDDLHHPVSSFSVINKMRDNNQLCDVFLRVGKSMTKAHRLVLASSSPYFYTMFNVDMAEKSQSEIELHDMDSSALQLLVEFSYSSRVLITEENVQKLLSASSFLQIDSVRDACCTFMIKKLSRTNCLEAWRSAETYSCNELSTQSRICVLKNFESVVKCEEFLDLSFSEVENLVSEDKLCMLSEDQIYQAVIRWIKYDLAERLQYNAQLFGHVRLTQISKDFLFDVVNKEPLMCNEPSCNKMLLDAIRYQQFPDDLPSKWTDRRLGGLGVFAIGGGCDDTCYKSGERYDFVNDRWQPIAPMSQRRAYAGITSMGNFIYAIGGYDGKKVLSSAECYDPITNKWSPVKSLDSSRGNHGISDIDGLLYICGGYDGSSARNSVERYDPLTNVWSSCPSMKTLRANCGVSVINHCLYVIGGRRDDTNYLSSVEMYDPRTSKWMAVPDMSGPRGESTVVTLDDSLYCVGGMKNYITTLSSGERLNVRRNAWEPIANMQRGRAYQGMVAVNGGLLVLGGYRGQLFLNSAERYNPRNDQWTTSTPMRMRRYGLGAALLYCFD